MMKLPLVRHSRLHLPSKKLAINLRDLVTRVADRGMIKIFINIFNHPLTKHRRLATLAKVLWWKFNQLFFHLPTIVKITDDFSIICNPGSSLGNFIVYTQWPEYSETQFLLRYLMANDVYIDVGAHIGSTLLPAASKITNRKLFGFEPTPDIFAQLLTNIRLNNLASRVLVFPQAVSHKNSRQQFVVEKRAEISHLANNDDNLSRLVVTTIKLDTFVSQRRITKINLLKIDTEGAELQVLQGARRLLDQHRIEIILFEVSNHLQRYGSNIFQLLNLIEKYQLQLFVFNREKLRPLTAEQFKFRQTTNLLAALKTKSVHNRLRSFF